MTNIYFKNSTWCLFLSLFCCLLTGLAISVSVQANELTDRQYSATQAQKAYDLEKSRYDDATALVNEQKQRVAQDQALLKERQKKQVAAKASMMKAKDRLDLENSKLKRAWNKGNH